MPTLDHDLNAAICSMASRKFPQGFDVVSEGAPDSCEAICKLLDAGKRMVVWSGGSDATIFGSPFVNWAFRAWHDWHHWQGRLPFTPEGEAEACKRQITEIRNVYGDNALTRQWATILECEINGQIAYAQAHGGAFPDDQLAFAKAYMGNPVAAVQSVF